MSQATAPKPRRPMSPASLANLRRGAAPKPPNIEPDYFPVEPRISPNAPESAKRLSGQELASALIDRALPEAVSVLVKSMRQRKSPTLALAAAAKMLDLSGIGEPGRKQGDEEGEGLGRLIELRGRARGAETVVPEQDDPDNPPTSK